MDAPAQQLPPGGQIGPYQIVRRLGAGGMGEVYLARHRHLERDAAIKVLLPEISMNQMVVSRFFTEARATAQLRHPNIVDIFDCDVLPDGRAYIVMEYLRGESLCQALARVRTLSPDWTSISALAGLVADALQAAHENAIVHRDLKPDNVYLSSGPKPREGLTAKVLDFGIAKLLSSGEHTGSSGSTPTRTGSLIGTPLYMSPEQCRGIPTIDHRADIYSLGCVVFEMVAGRPPFVAEASGDILLSHIIEQAPRLETLQPQVPAELAALVARMLAKDPAMRPQSMAEIVAVIEAQLGVRKAEFASRLQKPAGFPDTEQGATRRLPVAVAQPNPARPAHPARPAPHLPGTGSAKPAAATLPLAGTATLGHGTPMTSASDDIIQTPRTRARRILPVAIIASLVVVVGGGAAFVMSKPHPTAAVPPAPEHAEQASAEPAPPTGTAAFVPPSEVKVQIVSAPERAAEPLPTPTPTTGHPGNAQLGNTKKKRSGKPSSNTDGSRFKAVGD